MTAKDAIIARCRDCQDVPDGGRFMGCAYPDCQLYGLAKQQDKGAGTNRNRAIAAYCAWCVGPGNSTGSVCVGDCPIRKLRESRIQAKKETGE